MSGASINDSIGATETPEFEAEQMSSPPTRGGFQIPPMLKAPTGEGSVGEYVEHPLNFNASMHMARVLRGLTGMLGTLNYAAVDIVIGGLGFLKDKRKVVENVANPPQP
jgi:hypothetical protein